MKHKSLCFKPYETTREIDILSPPNPVRQSKC